MTYNVFTRLGISKRHVSEREYEAFIAPHYVEQSNDFDNRVEQELFCIAFRRAFMSTVIEPVELLDSTGRNSAQVYYALKSAFLERFGFMRSHYMNHYVQTADVVKAERHAEFA